MHIEKEIVKRITQGDTKAFEQLYFSSYVYLCSVAIKYVYKPEPARELVNDVFLSVWNNRATLTYPVEAYLISSVQNRCLNYFRKKRLEEVPLSEIHESMIDRSELQIMSDTNPLASLENKDLAEQIKEAVDKLPEKCREIFIEHLYHNKSYDEIAQMKNIKPSTVRVQIKIALSKLKLMLGDLYLLLVLLLKIS